MERSFENLLERMSKDQRKAALWIRDRVLEAHPFISEGTKYGGPFILLYGKPLAYFFIHQGGVDFTWVAGKKINEMSQIIGLPQLDERNRTFVASLCFNSMADFSKEDFLDILSLSIAIMEEKQMKKARKQMK